MTLRPLMFSLALPMMVLPLAVLPGGVLAQAAAPAADAARPAGVVSLMRQAVPVTVTLTGQAAAHDQAAIRPLVSGLVMEILYDPGRPVTAGDALFRIDDRSYQADLTSAEATLSSATAAVAPAEASVARAERLLGTGATQETLDGFNLTLAQARANVSSAQAAVDIAKLNLERTTVTSPINGFVDIPQVSVGDLVTANQTDALTTVTNLDPIYVDLSEASARMLMMRARFDSGEIQPGDRLDVALRLENGQEFQGKGTFTAMSQNVSTATGTINIRVRFDNPKWLIMPGMFVTAQMTLGTTEAFLVPQLAASPNADGTVSVWVLDEASRAQEMRLHSIGTTDRAWIVAQGLEPGARLLVDNIDNMIAGAQVAPVEAVISDAGVVSDAGTPAEAPETPAPAPLTKPEGN